MRKLILISALLLASASAQAGQPRGLLLTASDTTAASTTDMLPQPLPPVAKSDSKSDTKNDAQPQQQAREPAAPRAGQRSQARRHESNEAMARRIAARYGISW
jgi:hypothetical protein